MIGRLPECAVPLSDPQVSRHHAEVRPDHDGYRVVDLGSMNGTLVNGTRISEHVLRDGDEIVDRRDHPSLRGVLGTRCRNRS